MAKLTPEEKAYYASHVPGKDSAPPSTARPTLPPPPPPVSSAGRNIKALLIALGVTVGVIALFGILNNMSGGGSAQFSGHYVDSGISAGGRWVVTISVTNSGSDSGSPSCDLVAVDGDGVSLAADVVELDPIAPGASTTTRVLTGLKPGENLVASWSVDCS